MPSSHSLRGHKAFETSGLSSPYTENFCRNAGKLDTLHAREKVWSATYIHTLYRLGWKSGMDLRGIASTKLIMTSVKLRRCTKSEAPLRCGNYRSIWGIFLLTTSYYHIKVLRLEWDPFVCVCVCVWESSNNEMCKIDGAICVGIGVILLVWCVQWSCSYLLCEHPNSVCNKW